MTTERKRVRIVNKSKECITLDFKGNIGVQKATWEEFNKIYEFCPDDKRYCMVRSSWQEKLDKASKLLDEALIYYLQVDWKIADPNQVPDLVQMGTVGLYVKEIPELIECSYLEAMRLLNDRAIQIRGAFGGNGFKGLGFDKLSKSKSKQEKDQDQKPNISTNKLGDFNPELQKLKEQLQSWEENK